MNKKKKPRGIITQQIHGYEQRKLRLEKKKLIEQLKEIESKIELNPNEIARVKGYPIKYPAGRGRVGVVTHTIESPKRYRSDGFKVGSLFPLTLVYYQNPHKNSLLCSPHFFERMTKPKAERFLAIALFYTNIIMLGKQWENLRLPKVLWIPKDVRLEIARINLRFRNWKNKMGIKD